MSNAKEIVGKWKSGRSSKVRWAGNKHRDAEEMLYTRNWKILAGNRDEWKTRLKEERRR